MAPLLNVRRLKVHYPIYQGIFRRQVDVVKAVDDVSFSLEKGHILGIVGESGSGKSTVARAITKLAPISSGEIEYLGHHIENFSNEESLNYSLAIQMVFQDPSASFNPRRTIGQSLSEGVAYHYPKENSVSKALYALEQVGLTSEFMTRFPHELSGGQQQRACIARALTFSPKIIILDEAVSSLDISVQAQILNLLLDLKDQFDLSYLFISHDLGVVKFFCDDVVVMEKGKICEIGPVKPVFENPENEYTQKLISSIPRILV